jgi:hypothetical protein
MDKRTAFNYIYIKCRPYKSGVGPWTKNVKKKARSLLFSFNTFFVLNQDHGGSGFSKKNEVKKLKKKIYKKALAMMVSEIADCSWCPMKDAEGICTQPEICDLDHCNRIIAENWLEKAEKELAK